ncbi:MAG: Mu transposase domain-containing protein [Gemmatimonadaceae bacterium]
MQHRVVATDALVAIGGSRYSVPARYVGATVTVRELLGSYEILHEGTVIARHTGRGRHQMVMEPAHYEGLLRPGPGAARALEPPRFDPDYPLLGDVAVRDLMVYADLVSAAAGEGSLP